VNNLAAINMRMAEIVIPPGQPWTRITDPNTVIAQSCAKCHAKTPPGNDNSLDQIIDSFGTFKSKQGDNNNNLVLLRSLLIDTTEPTKIPLVTQTPPAPGVTRQNIAAICTILNNQASNANKNLCTNLKDYQNSRSCGVGLPNVTCGGINGGGMFRNDQLIGGDNSLSVISFDVSGQAQKGTTTYTFLDTEGNLTAYNYQSRKLISSVKIIPAPTLTVTPGANFSVSGTADAQVSVGGGAPSAITIQFVITKSASDGKLRFTIFDTSANFLAGGTAQGTANVVLTNLN
jgi:hypothetical protein